MPARMHTCIFVQRKLISLKWKETKSKETETGIGIEGGRRGSVFRNIGSFWCSTSCCSLWIVHLQISCLWITEQDCTAFYLRLCLGLRSSQPTNVSPWTEQHHAHKKLPPQCKSANSECNLRKTHVVIHTNDNNNIKEGAKNELFMTWTASILFVLARFCCAQQHTFSFSSTVPHTNVCEFVHMARSGRERLWHIDMTCSWMKDCLPLLLHSLKKLFSMTTTSLYSMYKWWTSWVGFIRETLHK